MTPDFEPMLADLRNRDARLRLQSAAAMEDALRQALARPASNPEQVAEMVTGPLVAALGDPVKGVQVHAANCLELLAPHSQSLITTLRQAMRSENDWRSWGAAIVSARLGCWFPEMGPALSHAMGAADRDTRWAAAGYSLQLSEYYPEALSVIHEALKSRRPTARKMACYSLGRAGASAGAEEALLSCLNDPERDVRRAALLSLHRLPQLSGDAQRRAESLRSDPDEFVRRVAPLVAAGQGR